MTTFAALDEILGGAAARGEVPGVIGLVGAPGETLYEGAFGKRDIGKPQAMTMDTVVWIASMTKAVTGAAAMQLVEQGRIDLDAPAARVVAEIGHARVLDGFDADGKPQLRAPKRAITLRDLLTHTAGYSYDMWNPDIGRYMAATGTPGVTGCQNAALTTPLVADPGEVFEYGISIDWAGKMVEAVSGQRLESYFADHLFAPLGMKDTMFKMGADQLARHAPIHARTPDGLVATDMMIPQEPEFFMGGGGLYSTARDYLAFATMILNGGAGNGNRVLKAETVAEMSRDQIPGIKIGTLVSAIPPATNDANFFPGVSQGWGLSFLINRDRSPEGRPAGSLAWAGLANTFFWIDPKTRITGILLTQILPFFDVEAIKLFRAFETGVYRATA
ncbi:serine hydrolase domain-containing protein [Phreatobacter stygius]|uniref:Beta-lactamase family protein n=1 Tax=Phreatobacter stygius TaxID=1940610 RepID=A0A4D7AXP6_9HYPH|nr:serine hydrolase domain-containing protein [Phreatobacter stygius]QCI64911.1 beta-lactamase family protein [Phreatobacter stygius]